MSAAQRALPVPLARFVEPSNARQQSVRGRVEMRGNSSDFVAESLQIIHVITAY
jgi:hypothetical protein